MPNDAPSTYFSLLEINIYLTHRLFFHCTHMSFNFFVICQASMMDLFEVLNK